LETVEVLARSVAHELNNVAGIISNYASFIRQDAPGNRQILKDLEEIEAAGERCASLALRLVSLSTRPATRDVEFSPTVVLRDLDPLIRRILGETIELELFSGEGEKMLPRGGRQFELILINLAFEVKSRLPEGGRLALFLTRDTSSAGDRLLLKVRREPGEGDIQDLSEEDGDWGFVRAEALASSLGWSLRHVEEGGFEMLMG